MTAFAPDRAREIARTFDIMAPAADFYDDPYPYYAALRSHAPIQRQPNGSLFLTRYADLALIYRDAQTFTSDKRIEFAPKFGASPLYEHHTTSLVFNDAPRHTRVRRLLVGALSPKAVLGMEAPLERLVDELLDAMAERDVVDLIDDFAAIIPVDVIGNLLDVPRAERGPLRAWSLAILGALEPSTNAEVLARGNAAVTEFIDYLRDLVTRRRAKPGDPEVDVLTRLIQGESNDGALDERELLHNCIFILNAGHETTSNLIGNALGSLLDWPAQRALLSAQPTAIDLAVDEFLRFESSNQLGNRRVAHDTRIGARAIAAGTSLWLCIGAANRDPDIFAEADQLDLTRKPNRHLAFASGVHQCAGLHLARLEGRVAIGRFVQRFPAYARAAAPVRAARARFRGFRSLPVRVR